MWSKVKDIYSKVSLKTKLLVVLAAFVAASLLYGWYDKKDTSSSVYVEAPVSSNVAGVPQEEVTAKVKVYNKKEASKKIPALPQSVVEDPKKALVSSIDTPKTKTGFNVVTTLDTSTGAFTSYYKEKEQSLFGLESQLAIGVGAGASTRGNSIIRGYAEYDFARVGNVYGTVRAEADFEVGPTARPVDLKGFVNAEYRP